MRAIKWLAGLVLAFAVGTLPSCATMGGGGMKYIMDLSNATAYQA